jgi:hypothetical protein
MDPFVIIKNCGTDEYSEKKLNPYVGFNKVEVAGSIDIPMRDGPGIDPFNLNVK